MESSLKKIKNNKYELTVEVGKEDLEGYLKEAEDLIFKDVKIDGFRKGTAPRDLIRKQVGDKVILESALDLAVKKSLALAVEKEQLEVLKASELNVKENSALRLLYSVSIDTFPQVKIGDLAGLNIKRKEAEVSKEEVERAIDSILNSRSKLISKKGSSEKGDRVEVDFEITSEDGLPVEGGVSKNHPVIIGDHKFIPGFEEQLLGLSAGEEKKFFLSAPADYFNKSIAGKKLNFLIKVINVLRVEKPELNDDFAKSLGKFSNLSDLKRNIAEGITEEKKVKERQRIRLEILSQISKRSKIDLPENMVEERLDEMIGEFDRDLHEKGLELAIYLAHLQKTEEDLKKDWKAEAERQVTFSLILRKIAKEKKFTPSAEEIEEAANATLQRMIIKGQISQENIGSVNLDSLKEALAADLANEKTFSFLESQCSA